MKNISLLLIISLLSYSTINAQKKGDKVYDELGYLTAVDLYQDLAEGEQTYEVKLKLANSYRLNSQYEAAEYWYAQIIAEAKEETTILQYAQMLQANGKCEDAIRWYQTFSERSQQNTASFIEDCDDLKKFADHTDITLTNQKELNSEYHDFSPIPYKKGLVFTSMRGDAKAIKATIDPWTKSSFSDLYFAQEDGTEFEQPTILRGTVNDTYHDGTATFTNSGNQMIFTRTSKEKSSKRPTKNLKIYSAKSTNEEWKDTEELSFNDKEFSFCHPSLSVDGQRLYFASDRSGGFGGMDIYVSQKLGNKWGNPINLGPTVNTSGNEIFPFVDKKDKLFFASTGHKGLGGLDLFVVEKSTTADEHSFINRKNLGRPFNSPKDDFGFYINAEETAGYLSSNRPGGIGGDDIYKWHKKATSTKRTEDPFNPAPYNPNIVGQAPTNKMIKVAICDAKTGERVPNANVALIKSGHLGNVNATDLSSSLLVKELNGAYSVKVTGGQIRAEASFLTDENGEFNYYLTGQESYSLFAEKNRYYPTQQVLNPSQLNQNEVYCIPINPRNCINLNGAVKNRKFPKYIVGATVTFIDKCTGAITSILSDYEGKFEFCLECDCEYEIKVNKSNFKEAKKSISTLNIPCMADKEVNTLVELDLIELDPRETPVSKDYVNEYFTGTSEGNYQVGDVITLRNIYYDFDKYNIRLDAQYELDYLLTLMNNYPSMEIRLRSHTDSRGEGYYNKWLSRKRAVAARDYLINRGITAKRIDGYDAAGETELLNSCFNDVACSEEEHQANRRTEIVITNINQAVEIKRAAYGRK